jgi:hypothetical protein
VPVVSELGDLLELLHNAGSSFRTLRADFSVWERPAVKHRAIAASTDRRAFSSRIGQGRTGRLTGSFFGAPAAGSDSEDRSSLTIWVERPNRLREEQRQGEDVDLLIRDGELWWASDSILGATTNTGDAEPWQSWVGGEYEGLADPAGLATALRFEPLGPGERAGRRVLRARAVMRNSESARRDMALTAIGGIGADEYDLEIDAACGVVLYAEARLHGSAFSIVEAEAVAFDGAIDAEKFLFVAPRDRGHRV